MHAVLCSNFSATLWQVVHVCGIDIHACSTCVGLVLCTFLHMCSTHLFIFGYMSFICNMLEFSCKMWAACFAILSHLCRLYHSRWVMHKQSALDQWREGSRIRTITTTYYSARPPSPFRTLHALCVKVIVTINSKQTLIYVRRTLGGNFILQNITRHHFLLQKRQTLWDYIPSLQK